VTPIVRCYYLIFWKIESWKHNYKTLLYFVFILFINYVTLNKCIIYFGHNRKFIFIFLLMFIYIKVNCKFIHPLQEMYWVYWRMIYWMYWRIRGVSCPLHFRVLHWEVCNRIVDLSISQLEMKNHALVTDLKGKILLENFQNALAFIWKYDITCSWITCDRREILLTELSIIFRRHER